MSSLFVIALFAFSRGRLVPPDHGKIVAATEAVNCPSPPVKQAVHWQNYNGLFGRVAPYIDFDMFTGYIQVAPENYLFYWYFSPRNSDPKAPLVLYSNGGPGCSSMEAATTENSPLNLVASAESCSAYPDGCDFTQQFSNNPYSWNDHAHLLYVDNPRSVGFSFGTSFVDSSADSATDMVAFLVGFYQVYPELRDNKLVISGESYSGRYLPSWGTAIMTHNKLLASTSQLHINLAGVMIGNGWIVPKIQNISSLAAYAEFANMVPPGFTLPAREAGADDDNDDSVSGLHATMRAYMGYVFNPYDIRQRNMECEGCMGYNFTGWTLFMQREDLREALGVCPTAAFPSFELENQGCLPLNGFDADTTFSFQGAIGNLLDGGVEVLMYYGMSDTVCHFKGGERVAEVVPWSGRDAFNALQYSDLEVAGARAGSIKSQGRLSFALVESSGHMVPADQPATAAALLDLLLTKIHASENSGEGGSSPPSIPSSSSSSSSSSLLIDTMSPGALSLWIVLAFLGGCATPSVVSRIWREYSARRSARKTPPLSTLDSAISTIPSSSSSSSSSSSPLEMADVIPRRL